MSRNQLADGTGFSTGQKVAVGAMIAGGIAALAGAVVYARNRSGTAASAGLGRVESRTKAGGMTLTHYADAKMPIEMRVKLIQGLVWKSVNDPQMRELALAITGPGETTVKVGKRKFRVRGANCPARDGLCESEAIYNWTKANIRYTGDVAPVMMPNGQVEGVDLFQSAKRTTEFLGGDCDDHSGLNATLLALNGIQSELKITAPAKNDDWAHIYNEALLPKNRPTKRVPLDTTLPGRMFGREAPSAKNMKFKAYTVPA